MIRNKITGLIRRLYRTDEPTDELSFGCAEEETPTRAWKDQAGTLVIGPLMTNHRFHYARVSQTGRLTFFMGCLEESSVKLIELVPAENHAEEVPAFDPSKRTKREGLLWAVETTENDPSGPRYRCASCNYDVTDDLSMNAERCPKCGFDTKESTKLMFGTEKKPD